MTSSDDLGELLVDGVSYTTRLTRKYRARKPVVLPDPGRILAHIPGLITEVRVDPGAAVDRGEPLLVLEAMKMQNAISSVVAGTIARLHVTPGQRVAKGDLLAEIAPAVTSVESPPGAK